MPIEEAELHEVAIEEKRKGAEEERRTIVLGAQVALALDDVARGVRSDAAFYRLAHQLADLGIRPAVMPERPLGERHADIVQHWAL